jgi:hypothetical protein
VSLRGPRYQRMANDAYFTPPRHVSALLQQLPCIPRNARLWEPAAGAGHVARVLDHECRGVSVTATDLQAAKKQVYPVTSKLDFLTSTGPSGTGPLCIITNPPYGHQGRMTEKFLDHAFDLVAMNAGMVAFLLPFEFDAGKTRIPMVSRHNAFAMKLTLTERIRWINLPQSKNDPMGHHAWYVWDFNLRRRDDMRARGMLRAV